jgi:ankyrin
MLSTVMMLLDSSDSSDDSSDDEVRDLDAPDAPLDAEETPFDAQRSFLAQIVGDYNDSIDFDLDLPCSLTVTATDVYYDPDIRPLLGAPPLYHAADRGWCNAMRWLLAAGASVSARRGDVEKWDTPIHIAAMYNQREAVNILLDAGAGVDDPDHSDSTALMIGAQCGNYAMCKLLLSRGASLVACDEHGNDAIYRARGGITQRFLWEVGKAGGWTAWAAAPAELLALRRELPSLVERGRATRSSAGLYDTLLRNRRLPDVAFAHILAYWRDATV